MFESKGYSSAIKVTEKKIYKDKVETVILLDKKGNIIFTKGNGTTSVVQFILEQLSHLVLKI